MKTVRKLRDFHKKSGGIIESSQHFNYGKDPQKGSFLGKNKILPRLCSKYINDGLKQYINKDIKFKYCVCSGHPTNCCFNLNEYEFNEWNNGFNLSQKLNQLLAPRELSTLIENAVTKFLVTDKPKDCILEINDFLIYVKTISQDALSGYMEARKVCIFCTYFIQTKSECLTIFRMEIECLMVMI